MNKTTFSRMVEIGNLVSNLDEIEVTCDAWKTSDKDGQGQSLTTIDMELYVWTGRIKVDLTELIYHYCPQQYKYFQEQAIEEME